MEWLLSSNKHQIAIIHQWIRWMWWTSNRFHNKWFSYSNYSHIWTWVRLVTTLPDLTLSKPWTKKRQPWTSILARMMEARRRKRSLINWRMISSQRIMMTMRSWRIITGRWPRSIWRRKRSESLRRPTRHWHRMLWSRPRLAHLWRKYSTISRLPRA